MCVRVFMKGWWGGQTSTQVPNTVSPRAVSVSLKCSLHFRSDGKAQRRYQIQSNLAAGDTYRRGGINPACDPLGKQSVGGGYFPRTLVSQDRGEESRYGRAPARLSL